MIENNLPAEEILKAKAECYDNSDCESSSKPVCKEVVPEGHRICQPKESCISDCGERQYCTSSNTCEIIRKLDSNIIFDSTFILHYFLLVICGINSDCSFIPGRNICKEDVEGAKTCQPPTQCKIACSRQKFCTEDNMCIKPGTDSVQP